MKILSKSGIERNFLNLNKSICEKPISTIRSRKRINVLLPKFKIWNKLQITNYIISIEHCLAQSEKKKQKKALQFGNKK